MQTIIEALKNYERVLFGIFPHRILEHGCVMNAQHDERAISCRARIKSGLLEILSDKIIAFRVEHELKNIYVHKTACNYLLR